eukprot:89751_1
MATVSLSSPVIVFLMMVVVSVVMVPYLYYGHWKNDYVYQYHTLHDYRSQPCSFDALQHHYLMAHNAEHQRVKATHRTLVQHADVDVFIPILAYDWPSISELLDHGVCGIELDLHPKQDTYFPVRHINIYDEKSSCRTLTKCLGEISQWMTHYAMNNKHKYHCPIYIELDLKQIDPWNDQQLMDINQIFVDSFSKNQLYTPQHHGVDPRNITWRPWTDTHLLNKAFVSVPYNVIDQLFPNAVDPVSNEDYNPTNAYVETDYALFARCVTPSIQRRYCIIGLGGDITANENEHFLFVNNVGLQYMQLHEYPMLEYDHFVQLPDAVTADVNYWRNSFSNLDDIFVLSGYNKTVIKNKISQGLIPWKWWNAWEILAYLDAKGNNNGLMDTPDMLDFAVQGYDDDNMNQKIQTIMTSKLRELGFAFGPPIDTYTINRMHVNNPLIWIVISAVIETNNEFKIDLLPKISVGDLSNLTCQAIKKGFHYIKTSWPYQLSTHKAHLFEFVTNQVKCNKEPIRFFQQMECGPSSSVNSLAKTNLLFIINMMQMLLILTRC